MKTLDFDNFMQEKTKEKIEVTVYGKKYQIAAEIPAIVPVMMARAEVVKDNALATKMIMIAADTMFGKEAVEQMCHDGMSANNLALLVQQCFKQIQNSDDDDDSEDLSDEDTVVKPISSKGKK